jgi:hypothetical protein
MQPPSPPKIAALEVVPAQPTEADGMAIAHLNAQSSRSLPQVAYVVKVKLQAKPPITSMAWGLYVNDVRIPKYWEYEDGIYFTVLDPQFFADHKGERLRFSQDGVEFHDTGMRLPGAPAAAGPRAAVSSVLKAKSKTRSKPKARKAKAKKTAKKAKATSKSKRRTAR